MYRYIKGEVTEKGDSFIVLENGGIGYKIYTSAITMAALSGEATVYTYLHVREDIFDLYGFADKDELSMFQLLLGVSGVGPKAALSILSVVDAYNAQVAVITGDAKVFTKASGVGAKMAQRIVLELKDKLKGAEFLPKGAEIRLPETDAQDEAVSALMVLGYSQNDARRAVSEVDQSLDTEEIIKLALGRLMR